MDKSFNDEELSDIMKEIEALEEEFREPQGVVEQLAKMPEETSIPKTNKTENPVLNFEKTRSENSTKNQPTSMSFKVQGDLNLELFFEVGGKSIALEVTEAGLNIQLEDGVSFNVPLQNRKAV